MKLRNLLGVLVLSFAVASCGLIKEKETDEEKTEETAEEEGEKKAEEAKDDGAEAAAEAQAKAEEAKKAADELAKKAEAERAALEAEKAKLIEEKKAAEEAAAKAEAEKLEAEKKLVTEAVAGLSEGHTKTKLELRANLEAWESEGTPEKVQALTAFLAEYEKVEAELGGIKAYLMQDDLEKAKTGIETLKGTYEALEKQAAVLLEDKPQPLDDATRGKLLELIASESCLQKAVAAGTLTDADLPGKRAALLTAAGMSAEQYAKLQVKLQKQPEQTDLTVLEAHMAKMCPEAAPVEGGEALWSKACDHVFEMIKAQADGVDAAELEKMLVEGKADCIATFKKVGPEAADKAALCALAAKDMMALDACDPEKLAKADATGEVYWKKACDHAMGLMKAQMGGDLPQEEMDKIMAEAATQCLDALKKETPEIADKAATCVLATTSIETLDACDPKKIAQAEAGVVPEDAAVEKKVEEIPEDGAAVETVEEKVEEKPEEKIVEKVEEKVEEKPEEKIVEKVEEKVEEKPEEKIVEKVVEKKKPAAPVIHKNMKFTGSLKGKGKSHSMTLHKAGNKLTGTIWHAKGKMPMTGSFTKKGAKFNGKKGKNSLACSGSFKGARLKGKCTGTLGKSFTGNFSLKGKKKK